MNYELKAEELFRVLKSNATSSLTFILNDFSKGEIGVLGYLAFDNNCISEGRLSEELNVTTARIASILNSLESKGYIIRRGDELDKRKVMVVITDEGKELAIGAKKEIIDYIINIIKEVGEDDVSEYVRIALKIREVLNKKKKRGEN